MDIAKVIKYLNFKPKEGSQGEYFKVFEQHDNYKIYLDINTKTIDYGNRIIAEDLTTSNFSKEENFVVLECVSRLLGMGYSPDNIVLEKTWKMGHKYKGKLDILVTKKSDDTPYLMIECKTWGEEFQLEKNNMLKDGGQLFSYYQQDRGVDYLCLYSSRFAQNIEYTNSIIKIEEDWKQLSNKDEVFDHWNKNFKESGIFEEGILPYGIKSKSICRKDLVVLTKDDGSKIFNQFAQILRQNIISDKPNAFNKIFNLFLCKIVDEDKASDEELEFQWLETDNYKTLQKRLNDLYKQGMKLFFNKTITDISDEELDEIFFNLSDSHELDILKEKITDLRLQKNPEFAFKEVYDDKSFIDNGKVVKEIVELLQPYQLRYTHKHQFLGDFFELLLTTGLKQESGQFFTPVPLSQFIINCLPLENIINYNLKNNNQILPYIIDYAAGSGHFLTESMDELQKIIDDFDVDNVKESIKKKINAWKSNPYDWAEKYIYGIEADYRLIKTSKINCFLNGDGTAQLIHGDGLDNFYYSETYKDLLKLNKLSKDNSNFDILVTNPPYSVQAFRNTLTYGNKTFELFEYLSEKSSEIECLFVERAKQLLKIGGYAAIILPISFLSSKGIYFEARKILLKYFDIKAILKLGASAFMATDTKTMVLFLERKNNKIHEMINYHINDFIDSPRDFTVNGIERAFSKYVDDVFDNCNLEDYISLIKKDPNNNISQEFIFQGYKKKFGKKGLDFQKIIGIEKEKMFCYFLSYSQTVLTINPGTAQKEFQKFLGYSFSGRRGGEGIKFDQDENNSIITPLFDSYNKDNPKKVNYYVKKMFENEMVEIDDSFKNTMNYINLNEIIDFKTIDFRASINQNLTSEINWKTVWNDSNLVYLKDIAEIKRGDMNITESTAVPGNIRVVAGGKKSPYNHNVSNRDKNVITVSGSGKYAGFVNYWEEPIFASDCSTIISKDEEVISTLELYNHLKEVQEHIYKLQKGQAQEHVYPKDLEKIKFPVKFLKKSK